MPKAKVNPPEPLPIKGLTQTQFDIWSAELEAWLAADDVQSQFLPGRLYGEWQSQEQNPHRIAVVAPADPELPAEPNQQQRDALVDKRRRQCQVFISLVAKCVSQNHYLEITRNATSLTWVFNLIKKDYDLRVTGIDFLSLVDIKYDPDTLTPAAYFQKVKSHIMANTARTGERIQHENNRAMAADETLGPAFQDYILYNTIRDIDPRLTKHIQSHYKLKMAAGQRLTDLKADIFANIPKFLEEIQQQESLNALRAQSSLAAIQPHSQEWTPQSTDAADTREESLAASYTAPYPAPTSLAAFTTNRFPPPQFRGRGRGNQQYTRGGNFQQNRGGFSQSRRPFCRTCYDGNRGKDTYLSHVTNNPGCPSRQQFGSMEPYPLEVLEAEDHIVPGTEDNTDQVWNSLHLKNTEYNAGLAHIEPVPAQILSMKDSNSVPIHLELDNGATCSYITLKEAISRGYKIYPNSQASQLGDGVTMIKSCGEIDIPLYRNEHKLRFRAIVAQHLHCPVIGGTTFIKDNNIKQDFVNNQITLLGNKCTVPSTQREALLPVATTNNQLTPTCLYSTTLSNTQTTQPLAKPQHSLISIKSKRILLPGDSLTINTNLPDQDIVLEAAKSSSWPPPTLAAITNKVTQLTNTSNTPVILDGKKNSIPKANSNLGVQHIKSSIKSTLLWSLLSSTNPSTLGRGHYPLN